ncbi:hypothetical protein B0H13DRAFT_2659755 [Mycena leptocephala]|nr:hypothetical protein B0H13DRAFT_2659755 [Mycena leptocephala]
MRLVGLLRNLSILALEKMLNIKGHNVFCPCRSCKMKGARDISGGDSIYYIPSAHPDVPGEPRRSWNLPLRVHNDFIDGSRRYRAVTVRSARGHVNIPFLVLPASGVNGDCRCMSCRGIPRRRKGLPTSSSIIIIDPSTIALMSLLFATGLSQGERLSHPCPWSNGDRPQRQLRRYNPIQPPPGSLRAEYATAAHDRPTMCARPNYCDGCTFVWWVSSSGPTIKLSARETRCPDAHRYPVVSTPTTPTPTPTPTHPQYTPAV